MESKKINQLATELAPDLSDLTIIGDPTTGISKKITLSQMASLFTGTVEEYATLAAFPLVGVADTIYIALDTNIIYRYDTSLSAYVILSPNIINSLVFSDANGFDGTITLVGSVATLSITTALTLGSVPFIGASGALTQDNANLFFDDTNNRLGIATASPTTPLDVFGSGIIGRLNATSTNNAYLGFASNGTNKWSAGNVQSDHRFRIFSEANSAELITILQTGEFGIGIANPTTKFHIDGAASALIANLDANVSIAKSISFRSDNSARINLEVSGTESGSNAGADFFLRTFTDAGSLLETPFTIVRSTGVTTIKSLTLTNVLSVANGGTGSATQNFVDLTSVQTAAGAKTFSAITTISNATASTSTTTGGLVVTGGVGIGGALFGTSATFSGDVGIGAAPSAWATIKALEIYNGAIGASPNNNILYQFGNAFFDGSFKYIATDFAAQYRINDSGQHIWYTAPSGTAGTAATFTQRMTITNGGNVGIGVTPSNWSTGKTLEIGGTYPLALHNSNAIGNALSLNAYYNGAWYYTATSNTMLYIQDSEGHKFFTNGAGTINTTFTPTERMRITSGGYSNFTNIGTYRGIANNNHSFRNSNNGSPIIDFNHSGTSPDALFVSFTGADPNNTANWLFRGYSYFSGTDLYYIYSNGTTGGRSDIRWKKNIEPARNGYLEDLSKLEVVKYNWYNHENGTPKELGLIAQQVETIFPGLVDTKPCIKKRDIEQEDGTIIEEEYQDGDSKVIKFSVIQFMLLKGLQEANEKIEKLSAKIASLENK